jgi:HEAT repeat protein
MKSAPWFPWAVTFVVTMSWVVWPAGYVSPGLAAQSAPGDPSVSGLVKNLLSPEPSIRQRATMALSTLRKAPPSAWPSLRSVLATEDMDVRTAVAIFLGQSGDSNTATVRALVEALEFQPRMREQIVPSLEASGAVLAAITRSSCFGFCPSYSVHVLRDGTALYEGYGHVKVEGFASRRLTPAQLQAVVSAFEEADYFSLADRYPVVLDAGSATLQFSHGGRTKSVFHSVLSNPPRDAVVRLEQRFEEIVGCAEWVGTPEERAAAGRQRLADAEAGHAPMSVLRGWREKLADPRRRLRRLAARELYQAAERVPEPERSEWQHAASLVLAEALGDPDEGERYAAIMALQSRAAVAPEVVDALVKGLSDPSTRVRYGVYDRLVWVGPAAHAAVPLLLERVDFRKSVDWHFAARTLGHMGPRAEPAVRTLVRGLDAANEGDRVAAVRALGGIGPAASTAVPALEAALSDPDPVVRRHATEALRAIQRR